MVVVEAPGAVVDVEAAEVVVEVVSFDKIESSRLRKCVVQV